MVLVKDPLLRGAVLKVRHSDLVGSGGGTGRVSAALNFLSNLPVSAYFSDLSSPMAGLTKQVPFLVVVFSIGLLCVDMLFDFSTL